MFNSIFFSFVLGIQLGSGCFGRVLKGRAFGLLGVLENRTVAVKMARSHHDKEALEALVCELKIMVHFNHLGSHLNVVNLLGACTKDLKGNNKLLQYNLKNFQMLSLLHSQIMP